MKEILSSIDAEIARIEQARALLTFELKKSGTVTQIATKRISSLAGQTRRATSSTRPSFRQEYLHVSGVAKKFFNALWAGIRIEQALRQIFSEEIPPAYIHRPRLWLLVLTVPMSIRRFSGSSQKSRSGEWY